MANNYPNFQYNPQLSPQTQQNSFMAQQFFPQPQGNVYIINNSLEMANVPTGVGVSVALCLNESIVYLKTLQNGQPSFVGYKLVPFDKENPVDTQRPISIEEQYLKRLENVEKEISELKQKAGTSLKELIQ